MRPSPLRHPLAVLRQITGHGQKDFGELVGRSARTIQAIELGNLPLSADLAEIIARQTGVKVACLLSGNPSEPLVNSWGEPFSKKMFEDQQALLKYSVSGTAAATFAQREGDLAAALLKIRSSHLSAISRHQEGLYRYRLDQFVDALRKEFGDSLSDEMKSIYNQTLLNKADEDAGLLVAWEKIAKKLKHKESLDLVKQAKKALESEDLDRFNLHMHLLRKAIDEQSRQRNS